MLFCKKKYYYTILGNAGVQPNHDNSREYVITDSVKVGTTSIGIPTFICNIIYSFRLFMEKTLGGSRFVFNAKKNTLDGCDTNKRIFTITKIWQK